MHFDGTITLGAVLNIATLIVAIIVFGLRMDGRLKMAERWIEGHERCNERIISYMDENQKALSALSGDVAFLRGRAEPKSGPMLQDRYL